MSLGRPARPVRSVAGNRDVHVEIGRRPRKLDHEPPLGIRRHERAVRSLPDELALADLLGGRDWGSCEARRGPPVSVSRPAPRRAARIPAVLGDSARSELRSVITPAGCWIGQGASLAARRCGTETTARSIRAQIDHAPGAVRIGRSVSSNRRTRQQTAGARIQPEDAEGPFQTAAAPIGMPQDTHERFSGLDRGGVAQRDRKIVASVFPKLMNDAIRDPDRGIEEVQDGGESLQRDDDQIVAPDVSQLVKQDPAQLLRGERSGDPRGKMIVGRTIPQTAGAAMASLSTMPDRVEELRRADRVRARRWPGSTHRAGRRAEDVLEIAVASAASRPSSSMTPTSQAIMAIAGSDRRGASATE